MSSDEFWAKTDPGDYRAFIYQAHENAPRYILLGIATPLTSGTWKFSGVSYLEGSNFSGYDLVEIFDLLLTYGSIVEVV